VYQQIISPVDGFISWLLSSGNRAKRITQLEPKSNWDKESVGKMNDNTSSVAPDMVKNLIPV
jgi:penicillin amidase